MSAVPIGQELAATPLQVVYAMGAIANNGVLMKPWLVKEMRADNEQVIQQFEAQPVRRVVSEETAKQVADMLVHVVSEDGTARKAQIEGLKIAGKTGTAQKFDLEKKAYSNRKYVSSLLDFFQQMILKFVWLLLLMSRHIMCVMEGL